LDSADLYNSKKQYYSQIEAFFGDTVIKKLLETMRTSLTNLHMFIRSIPVFRPIEKDGVEYNSLFDKETVFMLFSYTFYSVLVEYIQAADRDDMLVVDIVEQKQRVKAANAESPVEEGSEQTTEDMEDYAELNNYSVDILIGNQAELKSRVARLLIAYLKIAERNKAHANFGYDGLMRRIHQYKYKEKAVILENLEKMMAEERNVEKLKMKHKLGKWNVGQQRGLFIYDKTTSDRERKENIVQGYTDIDDELEPIAEEGADADDAQHAEDVETDINHLTDAYADGQVYSEDEDDDFRDD
jgi:hypothetical protein